MTTAQRSTIAIVLGAQDFTRAGLASDSAFGHSASAFATYLRDERGLGLSKGDVLNLFDAEYNADATDAALEAFLHENARSREHGGVPISDVIVYYTGHGVFLGAGSDYALVLKSTRRSRSGAYRIVDLAKTLTQLARHARRYIILDCCFAAAAYKAFQTEVLEVVNQQSSIAFAGRGTSLLCAAAPDRPARSRLSSGPTQSGMTLFSECLVSVLTSGIGAVNRKQFTLRELGTAVETLMYVRFAGEGPRPEIKSPDERDGNVADVPFFPNIAYSAPLASNEVLDEMYSSKDDAADARETTKAVTTPVGALKSRMRWGRVRAAILFGIIALVAGGNLRAPNDARRIATECGYAKWQYPDFSNEWCMLLPGEQGDVDCGPSQHVGAYIKGRCHGTRPIGQWAAIGSDGQAWWSGSVKDGQMDGEWTVHLLRKGQFVPATEQYHGGERMWTRILLPNKAVVVETGSGPDPTRDISCRNLSIHVPTSLNGDFSITNGRATYAGLLAAGKPTGYWDISYKGEHTLDIGKMTDDEQVAWGSLAVELLHLEAMVEACRDFELPAPRCGNHSHWIPFKGCVADPVPTGTLSVTADTSTIVVIDGSQQWLHTPVVSEQVAPGKHHLSLYPEFSPPPHSKFIRVIDFNSARGQHESITVTWTIDQTQFDEFVKRISPAIRPCLAWTSVPDASVLSDAVAVSASIQPVKGHSITLSFGIETDGRPVQIKVVRSQGLSPDTKTECITKVVQASDFFEVAPGIRADYTRWVGTMGKTLESTLVFN